MTHHDALERLVHQLQSIGPMAVALSGGVDSMTLAALAHRTLGAQATMLHAVSPAVPAAASERVREHAERLGWRLEVFDAGEFADANYRANPVDRCYFCKSNLYRSIAALSRVTDKTIVSGTNTDDLGDYRPGLIAADEHRVRHPWVEAGIDKATIRAIAAELGFAELSVLPAAPCLSSRIETGIVIDPSALAAIDASERLVRERLSAETVRCRVRRDAIAIELDPDALGTLGESARCALADEISALFGAYRADRTVVFGPYRMGSAFLRPEITSGSV